MPVTIRIASYNLWNGAHETYYRLVDFTKEQRFDVLCLQEINGWEDKDYERLKDFADRAGYTDYQFGNSNSEYKLISFTTLPVTMHTVHVEGFWHCIVETRVKFGDTDLVILNLHLDPWKEDPRLREVERLLEIIDPSKPTILIGDFNSISRADTYPPEFLNELRKRKIIKFGQNELDFRVTDCLAAAGFVDVAAQLKHFETTVPTLYNRDEDHEVPARIDCAYVSSGVLSLVKDFAVLKSEETDKISDHYPIVLTLSSESSAFGELSASQAAADAPTVTDAPAPETPATSDSEVEIKLR